jgi:hypothetical protein
MVAAPAAEPGKESMKARSMPLTTSKIGRAITGLPAPSEIALKRTWLGK